MNTAYDPNLNDTNCCDISMQIESLPISDYCQLELSNLEPFRNISGCDKEIFDDCIQSSGCYSNDNTDFPLNENWLIQPDGKVEKTTNKLKCNEETQPKKKFKIWKCRYNCGKIFTQEKYMNSHILVMHENEKKVSCKICHMNLSTEPRLKNHMLRHSNIKHLICLVCLKTRTKELSCMRHHLLRKHNIGLKHSLFKEAFYSMSLKEIALEEKNKLETKKGPAKKLHKLKNIKLNTGDLQKKLVELAKVFQNKYTIINKDKSESNKCNKSFSIQNSFSKMWDCQNLTRKIVTAENGMKLIKLSNGQFRKITGVFVY